MKLGERIALAAGVLLLGWLVYSIGPAALWAQISQLSWGFLPVLSIHAVAVLLHTLGWRMLLPPQRRDLPFPTLAGFLLVGEAVNTLTPAAVVGGDFVRASLLGRRIGTVAAVGAVGQAAMAQFLSQSLFVLIGAPAALAALGKGGLRAGFTVYAVFLLVCVGLVLYFGWHPEALGRIRRWLERFSWFRRRWEAPESRWRAVATETLEALRGRPRDFALSVFFSYLGWTTGILEVFLILWLLKAPVGWPTAFVIEILTVAIEGMLFFVPGKIGTQEGGQYVIFLALALDPVRGVALGFIRKMRGVLWSVPGLLVLAANQAGRGDAAPKTEVSAVIDSPPR